MLPSSPTKIKTLGPETPPLENDKTWTGIENDPGRVGAFGVGHRWRNGNDIYDGNFVEIEDDEAFVDPSIPNGYAPFGIENIKDLIYVTYAKQDTDRHDDVPGPGYLECF